MPLIPRMQVFEIDDQTWFPSFLRTYVQSALTVGWNTSIPIVNTPPASRVAASVLLSHLGSRISAYRFLDFCAGAGGPTPMIEAHINAELAARGQPRVPFVMTDLHPNVWGWERAVAEAAERERMRQRAHGGETQVMLSFESQSVDAAAAPRDLMQRWTRNGGRVFRLFNLAFHHFDDTLARRILKNTVETSDGFAIFELQDRSFSGFMTLVVLGIGMMLIAPFYALKWRAPAVLLFTYVLPILPFVVVFDGIMSAIRTRTPEEVELLLRTCGAKDAEEGKWIVKSGSIRYVWPFCHFNYVVCMPEDRQLN
ncbi:hypothetical protein BROUX41_002322 [Berkeleyomyces rouxiae]|uniref:uncharacterized protein n=1 Tax=Berkeleyomyces rouxiae TaxID=2035830 RepID=UPI003B80CA81